MNNNYRMLFGKGRVARVLENLKRNGATDPAANPVADPYYPSSADEGSKMGAASCPAQNNRPKGAVVARPPAPLPRRRGKWSFGIIALCFD